MSKISKLKIKFELDGVKYKSKKAKKKHECMCYDCAFFASRGDVGGACFLCTDDIIFIEDKKKSD